jgi:HEAT repeat protein
MTSISSTRKSRELSPEGQAAAAWFRQLARMLRVFRLYNGSNPNALSAEETTVSALAGHLATNGGWRLRFSATEIFLEDESVVRVAPRVQGAERVVNVTEHLPFLFYRDGIRRLTLTAGAPRRELDTLIQILRDAGCGNGTQDDLVTLLWQANLSHVQIEAVPLEQTIYLLSSHEGGDQEPTQEGRGQVFAWSPAGAEIRADLGQAAGVQGLHRDTFDDWVLPEEAVDVPGAFALLGPLADSARPDFLAAWDRENSAGWIEQAPDFLRGLHALDGSEDMRRALGHSTVTWLASALQRMAWDESRLALGLLNELDRDRALIGDELAAALSGLDTEAIAERFDEGEVSDQSHFAALTVGLGAPAIGLCVEILTRADKARARAAAVTALCYLCADDPHLLAPWLADPRWQLVRNILFVLGHIGGPDVVPLLRSVAHHPEPRVRRQLVQALGSVPPEDRVPLLLGQLDARDPQLLAAALNMLTRERDPRVARAILALIESPDFDSRNEDNQRTLFGALGDIAGDPAVPALEALLHQGGWFARRTFQRVATARTLRQIGTPAAMAALEAGAHARSEAVRTACLEALGARSRP